MLQTHQKETTETATQEIPLVKRKETIEDATPVKGVTIDTSLLAGILKETGGQTFELAGRTSYFVDTGSLSLNYICSGKFITGGLPGGKIIEVYGPPATSKSLLGYCALAGAQRMGGIGAYLDCERAGNAEFAQRAGHVDTSSLLLYEPISIEQVESKIINVTRAIRKRYGPDVPIFWVWDSIGVTPCQREWEEVGLPENPTKEQLKAIGAERPGERARACGDALRKLNPFIAEQNATLYIINQTRQAIGALWDDEVTAGGGKALPFYASCRIRTSAQKEIKDAKRDIPLGVNLTFRNKKNRSFTPGLYTKGVQLYFANGINPVGGLLSCLIAAGRVDPTGKAGYYTVLDPWAGGKEVKFRASKERNDVPVDVLFDCPSIIDADSRDQVEKYLSTFGDAIKLSGDENVKEVDKDDDILDGSHLVGDENSYD